MESLVTTKNDNLIVFPHCPKTGGTTLKERYRYNNSDFIVWDWATVESAIPDTAKVLFGHDVPLGKLHNTFSSKNLVHITCLRDPIDRMMSMYNFFKTQLKYMDPDQTDVDFYLWFINKDVMRPMRFTKQYEYYLFQHIDHIKWFENETLKGTLFINDMYQNTVLDWDVERDTTVINWDKVEQCYAHKNEVEDYNMNFAWEQILSKFDHVFFQEDDIVVEFDKLLDQYELDLTPDTTMTRTNETYVDLERNKLKYVKFKDLDSSLQEVVELDLKQDIEFYNRCRERWKH